MRINITLADQTLFKMKALMANSFPDEVLDHILSFIDCHSDRNSVSLVSKSWYEIKCQCRCRVFVGNCYTVSPMIVIGRFSETRSITLKGKPHFVDFNLVPESWGGSAYPWISVMAEGCPWLEELRLKRMVVTDEALEVVAKSFKIFKVLVLCSCEGFSTDGLAWIASSCM